MEIQYLNRGQAAEYVRRKGLPCAKTTLAKLACVGGGPNFRKFGKKNVVYTVFDLDVWIKGRLTEPVANTSDLVPPNGAAVDGLHKNSSDFPSPYLSAAGAGSVPRHLEQ